MNANDRQVIHKNIDYLSKVIDLKPILPLVVNKNIFTQPMIDDILKIEPEMDRIKCFLQDLTRRGPQAYEAFVEILFGTNQIEAGRVLRPETFERGLNQEELLTNIVYTAPHDSGGGVALAGGGDHFRSHTIASNENEDFLLKVKESKNPMVGPNYYSMTSSPRGFCLIINNIEFINNVFPKRSGSEAEAFRLRDVFKELHFTVVLKDNLTKEDTFSTIHEYSKRPDLRKQDALILIVLSHGESGYFFSTDGIGVNFEDVVRKLNNENCPQLINKPKLFFFNCCRGYKKDTGPNFLGNMDIDKKAVPDAGPLPKIPLANDMMICFSTVDGYVSWRNEETGSWFGTALSQALMKHSHDKELHHILTIASDLVNNKVTEGGEKQVMEHTFRGFRKLFYFNPGITGPPNA